nr:DUF551 domain-containing protein [Klebsiella pneumoniae]
MTKSTITRDQLRALAVKKVESLKFAITQSAFTTIRRGLEEELQLAEFALAAMDSEPHTDDELSNLLWYSQEATCHSDPNYYCEFQRLATPGLIAGIIRELLERRKAAMDSKPVILYRQINPVNGMKTYWAELDPEEFRHLKQHTDENAEFMTLYRHAQPAPVVPDDYQRLRELYHAQEKRLFKIAQRIKGPAFDKYSHSPSQAIDVLEGAIFGEDGACRAAMLAAAPQSPGGDHATVPGKWIPVSERMPEAGGDMIVFTDGIVMSGVSYAKKKGFYIQALEYDDDEPVDSVTHWMPLPAAPQEVKDAHH